MRVDERLRTHERPRASWAGSGALARPASDGRLPAGARSRSTPHDRWRRDASCPPRHPRRCPLCALALPGAAQAQSPQPRIISGSDVSSTAHPYQVRLSIRFGSSTYQCGGVIRDATHVMTAAHCVVNSGQVAAASSVTVHYGNANRSLQSAASVYSVTPAPEYVAGDGTYDAALLTLNRALAGYGGSTVQPVALASAAQLSSAVGAGANAVVSGWGLTEQGSTSQNLKATTVTLRADSVCRNVYGSRTFVSARFVCAGGTGAQGSTNNPDSCSGDSGGPMVISTSSGYALVGLVSFGPTGGCGRGGLPGRVHRGVEPGPVHAPDRADGPARPRRLRRRSRRPRRRPWPRPARRDPAAGQRGRAAVPQAGVHGPRGRQRQPRRRALDHRPHVASACRSA